MCILTVEFEIQQIFLETICPINRQSGIDELLLSLSTPIKSIINRDQWKMSSILLRICNMSFGGLNATTPRFVIEGSNDFKNLPQRQKVQEPFWDLQGSRDGRGSPGTENSKRL